MPGPRRPRRGRRGSPPTAATGGPRGGWPEAHPAPKPRGLAVGVGVGVARFEHDDGDVVVSASREGELQQVVGGLAGAAIRRTGGHLVVAGEIAQAVRAEDHAVARSERPRVEYAALDRGLAGAAPADPPSHHMGERAGLGFLGRQLPERDQLFHQLVVAGAGADRAVAHPVGAAVAHPADHHLVGAPHRRHRGGAGKSASVAAQGLAQRHVDGREAFAERVCRPRQAPAPLLGEGAHRELARLGPPTHAAHAVAHQPNDRPVVGVEGRPAVLVLVVNEADVGHGVGAEGHGHGPRINGSGGEVPAPPPRCCQGIVRSAPWNRRPGWRRARSVAC